MCQLISKMTLRTPERRHLTTLYLAIQRKKTVQKHVLDSYSQNIHQFAFKNLLSVSVYSMTSAHILLLKIAPQLNSFQINLGFILAKLIVHLFECGYPLYVSLNHIFGLKLFLASHSNFNLHTFNCNRVGAIHKKQPLRYEFSIRFVNPFACLFLSQKFPRSVMSRPGGLAWGSLKYF